MVLVGGVVGAALLAGWWASRHRQPVHPPVDLAAIDVPPGVVAFTSTQCDNCKRVMAMLRDLDVPVREVTHELEAGMFAAAGVEAVPLLVVTDRDGRAVRRLAGTPTRAAIKRAVRAAGWA
jgi:glutaredoxin